MEQALDIVIKIFLAVYVLFIPGLLLSFLFFRPKQIDIIERIALSFALSIAVVPLLVFYTNLIGVKITQLSVALQILALICILWIALGIKYMIMKERHDKS
jgi:uncharacterized membrane protein